VKTGKKILLILLILIIVFVLAFILDTIGIGFVVTISAVLGAAGIVSVWVLGEAKSAKGSKDMNNKEEEIKKLTDLENSIKEMVEKTEDASIKAAFTDTLMWIDEQKNKNHTCNRGSYINGRHYCSICGEDMGSPWDC